MFLHFTSPTCRTVCRAVAVVAGGLLAATALSGCGGGASAKGTPGTPASSASGAASSRAGRPPAAPAASGLIAEIAGTTMQVQNQQTGQVAVTWSGATKFSHTVSATLASVKAGSCVTAIAPPGTSASATAFTATTLVVAPSVNGSCTLGRVGPGGQRPSGLPSRNNRPSGALPPSGFPSRGADRGSFGAVAGGKVVSASGSKVVIAARGFGAGRASITQKAVTIGSATKITTEVATTSASLKVGRCATAQGKADSTGTVAATSVRITDATNGQCSLGFGGRGTGG